MTAAATALTVEHEPKRQEVAEAPSMAPASESAAIFQIIERAARDHTVDIDKMKELMAMHKAMRADNAELDFDRAMAAAQEEMQPVRGKPHKDKTAADVAEKSKIARIRAKHLGIYPPSKAPLRSRGFSPTRHTEQEETT